MEYTNGSFYFVQSLRICKRKLSWWPIVCKETFETCKTKDKKWMTTCKIFLTICKSCFKIIFFTSAKCSIFLKFFIHVILNYSRAKIMPMNLECPWTKGLLTSPWFILRFIICSMCHYHENCTLFTLFKTCLIEINRNPQISLIKFLNQNNYILPYP